MCAGGATAYSLSALLGEAPASTDGDGKAPVCAKDDAPPQCPAAKQPKEPEVPNPPKKQPKEPLENDGPKESAKAPVKEPAKESVDDGAPARKDLPKAPKNAQLFASQTPGKAEPPPNEPPKNPEAKQPKEPGVPNLPKEPLGNEDPREAAKELAKEAADGGASTDGAPAPKESENVQLFAPQTSGKAAPPPDEPAAPPKGGTPEHNKMISAPEDVKSQAKDAGATYPDKVYISGRGDVYELNKDGTWKYLGHLDGGNLVPGPARPEDPANMIDLSENVDIQCAIPNGAIPKLDSFGNVWDMFDPNNPKYLGQIVNGKLERANNNYRRMRERQKRRRKRLKGLKNLGNGSRESNS